MILQDLGFEHHYKCKVLPEIPKTGLNPIRFFGQGGDSSQPALIVEFQPDGGAPWIGNFEPLDPDYPLTGIYACPSPHQVCIVAQGEGYLVRVNAPSEWERLPVAPTLGIERVPDRPILFAWDFQDLLAYGPGGLIWWVERLSLDGIRILEVTSEVIRGVSIGPLNEPPYEQELPFCIAPETGDVEGGWGNPTLRRRPAS